MLSPDKEQVDRRHHLIEHLRELKSRMVVSLVALFIAFALCYLFADRLFAYLAEPLVQAMGGGEGRRLIYTGLPEAFFVKVKLSFFAGLLLCFPVIATQFYLFLAPGLYKKEKRVLAPYLIAAPLLFAAGAALAYFYIFPLAWKFFLGFEHGAVDGIGLPVVLEARISEYLGLVIQIVFAFGVAFQLPILLTLLVRMEMMSADTLKKGRRYAVVILITAAAALTPPDIVSQIGLFVPLYLLYECSIVASAMIEKRKHDAVIARSETTQQSS